MGSTAGPEDGGRIIRAPRRRPGAGKSLKLTPSPPVRRVGEPSCAGAKRPVHFLGMDLCVTEVVDELRSCPQL